ncbi:hypothetical protein CFBP6411_04380 [Pseudomonas syringae group genomosp. 3]|jgi:hypothetical protein|uniref:AbiTii domain-containing protein n=1 Tax=Pseudomonas syringae group genomosp. 3 TaxID=251701 RepID=A0A2K4WIK4_9PSED|nr:hypothetical protein CFBP6411_04380 [Pseudomonas syringae group genomosp. 3]
MMLGDDINDMISVTPIHDSVSQIIDLVERSDGGSVMIKFPQDMSMTIMRMIGRDIEPALHIPVHQLVRIVDVTKTKILDFALDLETRGILGEGIRFSKAEEQLAQSITYHTINIERMDNSQIQQASDGSNPVPVITRLVNPGACEPRCCHQTEMRLRLIGQTMSSETINAHTR